MKVNIALNGKTAELDIPDEKLVELGLMEKKKPTGYERVETKPGNGFHYVMFDGSLGCGSSIAGSIVEQVYNSGNYYSKHAVAEANARADKLMRQLRRFAAENGGIPSAEDWKAGPEKNKWYIVFDHTIEHEGFRVWHSTIIHNHNVVYFNSGEACRKAIELYKDELTWYFTEYQAMLY